MLQKTIKKFKYRISWGRFAKKFLTASPRLMFCTRIKTNERCQKHASKSTKRAGIATNWKLNIFVNVFLAFFFHSCKNMSLINCFSGGASPETLCGAKKWFEPLVSRVVSHGVKRQSWGLYFNTRKLTLHVKLRIYGRMKRWLVHKNCYTCRSDGQHLVEVYKISSWGV